MEKLLAELRLKANNCDNTNEGRARKGAYIDCIVMIKQVKNCTIPPVINRRELLIDFLMEIDEVYGMHVRKDAEKCADDYLKSINSL